MRNFLQTKLISITLGGISIWLLLALLSFTGSIGWPMLVFVIFYFSLGFYVVFSLRRQYFYSHKIKTLILVFLSVILMLLNFFLLAPPLNIFYLFLSIPSYLVQSFLGAILSKKLGLSANLPYSLGVFLFASFGLIVSYYFLISINFTLNNLTIARDEQLKRDLLSSGDISLCNNLILSQLQYLCPAYAAVGAKNPDLCLQAESQLNCLVNAASVSKNPAFCQSIKDFNAAQQLDLTKVYSSPSQTAVETISLEYESCLVSVSRYVTDPATCNQLQKPENVALCRENILKKITPGP